MERLAEIGVKFPLPSVAGFRCGGAKVDFDSDLNAELLLGRPKSDFTTGGVNDLGAGLAPGRVFLNESVADLAALPVFLRRSSAAAPAFVFNLLAAELNCEPTELIVGLAPKLEPD